MYSTSPSSSLQDKSIVDSKLLSLLPNNNLVLLPQIAQSYHNASKISLQDKSIAEAPALRNLYRPASSRLGLETSPPTSLQDKSIADSPAL